MYLPDICPTGYNEQKRRYQEGVFQQETSLNFSQSEENHCSWKHFGDMLLLKNILFLRLQEITLLYRLKFTGHLLYIFSTKLKSISMAPQEVFYNNIDLKTTAIKLKKQDTILFSKSLLTEKHIE